MKRLRKALVLVICVLFLCMTVTSCGPIMRTVNDVIDSAKGMQGNMHYEEKMLGFSMEIPYEWEVMDPDYWDDGGIARFKPDAEIYGRDDLEVAVLYLPNASYSQAVI